MHAPTAVITLTVGNKSQNDFQACQDKKLNIQGNKGGSVLLYMHKTYAVNLPGKGHQYEGEFLAFQL